MKRVAFNTLGCRLNIAESGSMAQGFAERGYEIVEFGEDSDYVVINTCTVTNKADSECRNIIRKAHKISPGAKIIVVGCYAQLEAAKIAEIEGVELILGTTEKHKLFEHFDKAMKDVGVPTVHVENSSEFFGAATQEADLHTRAFLKIQDGCNYFCSYCIIPYARGRARSIKVNDAVEQAKSLISKGYKEIVLTGINIGEFSGSNGERFEDLVRNVLELDGLERLRISSIEPNTLSDELFELLGHKKMMPHFHIPIQSGDDVILENMRRHYNTTQFKELIYKINQAYPYASIGTDVIVGFPGETELLFENTYNLLQELPITHFHVFPYSVRKGTRAEKLEGHLRGDVKKERVKRINSLGEEKLTSFMMQFKGKTLPVLFEQKNKNGNFEGFTPNYLRVEVSAGRNLKNMILEVELDDIKSNSFKGILL